MRKTPQRRAIAEAMAESLDFRSAQDIHDYLRAQGHTIGLATVYRTLTSMADAGDLDVLRGADGEARYRQCETTTHHHHLTCRVCNQAVEISGPGIERWTYDISKAHGYVDIDHTLELVGTCSACARKES